MALPYDDISITTIIGLGSGFSGNLNVKGGLMIDGDVDGNIETTGNIIIGEKARIKGNVVSKSAIISGIVIGDVSASEGIKLLSSSTVIGDVTTKRLHVEDKVVLHGHCISLIDSEEFEKVSFKYKQSKEIRGKAVRL